MRRRGRTVRVTDVPARFSARQRTRQRWYFTLMGCCLVLIVLAWNVVRLFSTTAAVVMSVVAMVLPPLAAIVGTRHDDR